MSKRSPADALTNIQQSVGKYLDRGSAELHYALKMFQAGAFKMEPPRDIAAFVNDVKQ